MNKLIENLNKEEGVTLVELLAAIAILSIIVTAFLAYFIQAANTNSRTDKMNEATFLAQSEMEEITSYTYGNYNGAEVNEKYFDGKNTRLKTAENGMTIVSRLVDFSVEDAPDETLLYRVTVRVKEGEAELAHMESRVLFEKNDIGEDQEDGKNGSET